MYNCAQCMAWLLECEFPGELWVYLGLCSLHGMAACSRMSW
jgi:hypothetical protein